MPVTSAKTPRDRAEGENLNVHPRTNGDLILLPDDILEGQGLFTVVDSEGNPEGFRIGNVEKRDGWHVYEGATAQTTTRQTIAALSVDDPSFLLEGPSVTGHAPPAAQMAAKVAYPATPYVQRVKAGRVGYPASTEERPYWYAWSFAVRLSGGRMLHTLLSPFAKCEPNANGQGFRVPLPPPESTAYAGLWLTAPGTSTMDRAGRAYLQAEVNVTNFASGYYNLSGPFRFNTRSRPTRNETGLPAAGRASFQWIRGNYASRPGIFRCAVSFATARGEGPAGPMSAPLTIRESPYFGTENRAGRGMFRVRRPAPNSPGATGWYAYVETGGTVYRVYDKTTGVGLTRPIPLSEVSIGTAGWEGGEHWAVNDTGLMASSQLPDIRQNASSLADPTEAPEVPLAFGAELPEPGRRYIRVTDTYRGKESSPSPAVTVDLAAGEILRVVYRSPVNAIPNASYIETDPDDLPFDHLITAPPGAARVESGEMVLEVLPTQKAAVYEEKTAVVAVDSLTGEPSFNEAVSIGGEFAVEPPAEGGMSGTVESVLIEEDESGSVLAETVLFSTSEAGEHEFYVELEPAASSGASEASASEVSASASRSASVFSFLGFNPATFGVRLAHRIVQSVNTAIQKNLKLRIKSKQVKNHVQRPRPVIPAPPPASPRPGRPPAPPGKPPVKPNPGAPLPPGSEVGVTKPPAPPASPLPPKAELRPFPEPDRPRSEGTMLEDLAGFEGGIPQEWTVDQNPAATMVEASATAAISGSHGLLLADTGTAQPGRARIHKNIAPDGRHDLAVYAKNRLARLPASGTARLHPLSDSSGRDIAWLEVGADREAAKLTITSAPKVAGNVSLYLDGVKTDVAVTSARETATLNITRGPTAFGAVSIALGTPSGGRTVTNLSTGGQAKVASLTVQRPRYNGYVNIVLGGVSHLVRGIYHSDSTEEVARKIRRRPTGYPGWKASGARNQVIFEATGPGPRGACDYGRGTSATPGTMVIEEAGVNESASELAARIRQASFPGWRTGGSGASVTFTAVGSGSRPDMTFSGEETGTEATATVGTQGASDTPEALAARIRGRSYAGWTTGGTGREVTFEAQAIGFRRDFFFSAGPTQAEATFETAVQGKNGDVFAVVREASGAYRRRRIMSEVAESSVFETDLAVSGAGTDEAIVSVWGSLGSGPRELLARFEEVDLTDALLASATLGVSGESRAATTWELHVDDARVTDRGLVYHRDHDPDGNLINQLHGYFVPRQPTRDDLLLQGPEGEEDGKRIAVFPGSTYSFGAFVRHRGVSTLARPLHVSAVLEDGTVEPIGCVTGEGLRGGRGWTEYVRRVRVPEGCAELLLRSLDTGPGEIVVQEVVCSLGEEVKRAGWYAASGSHTATLRVGTHRAPPNLYSGRRRKELAASVDEADGANNANENSFEVLYRALSRGGVYPGGPWGAWGEAGETPDRGVVEALVTLSGDGLRTPVLRSGFPMAEYDLTLGKTALVTLVKEDRSELPGGASFASVGEWSNPSQVGVSRTPAGRLTRSVLSDPVGNFPESVVQLYTPEAKNYLIENWGREEFVVEARPWGEMARVKMSAPPAFEQVGSEFATDEGRFGLWEATIAPCEVTERRPLL